MSMLTLVISCSTTSNLPWFMDLTCQTSMQYCPLQHLTFLNHQSLLSPIHNWVLFLLWLRFFILSGVISPLISGSILGNYRPGEFIFQYPMFLPFHTVHRVLKARILKSSAIPFSSGPHFVWTLHLTHPSWVTLHGKAHSFIELDKALVHVISLISSLWLWFSFYLPFEG